ncbi:MAG: pitrilysin family protein [Bacteroidota bacterium]
MPDIQDVGNLKVPRPDVWFMSNGVPVYEIDMGTQEIVKLELAFYAGRPFEQKKLAARSTPSLLKEGTKNFSSAAIAETMDFYGATLLTPFHMDTSNVLLYSLSKHFEKVLPILAEVISVPSFPQKELDNFIQRNQQRLQVELTKNDVLAYRKFTENIFGENHPYGYNSFPDTYASVTREDVQKHFTENYTAGNCTVFLSGKISPRVRELVDKYLGQVMLPGKKRVAHFIEPNTNPQQLRLKKGDKSQKAIRIGRRTFTRQNEDYHNMYVLNALLGGYFGSRLMANIREEKGYTYSIYSSNEAMLYDGYFNISSEVGNEFVEDTIKQIYFEMDRLKNEPVGEDELAMVKNYLLGSFLTNLDGPFNIIEIVKTFILEGLPVSDFEKMTQAIKEVTPTTILETANKYFNKEDLWEVIV